MSQKTVPQPRVILEAQNGQVSSLSVHQMTALVYLTLVVLLVMASIILMAVNDLIGSAACIALAAWTMKALGSRMDRVADEQAAGLAGEF